MSWYIAGIVACKVFNMAGTYLLSIVWGLYHKTAVVGSNMRNQVVSMCLSVVVYFHPINVKNTNIHAHNTIYQNNLTF